MARLIRGPVVYGIVVRIAYFVYIAGVKAQTEIAETDGGCSAHLES